MKRSFLLIIAAFTLGVAAATLYVPSSRLAVSPAYADVSAQGENLMSYMTQFQRISHKIGLAIDAGNKEAAKYYAGELEEEAGVVVKHFPQYDGFAVGALLPAMLTPYLAPLKAALDAGNMSAASSSYDNLITGCNACHTATQRTFIKVVRVKTNPFNQSF